MAQITVGIPFYNAAETIMDAVKSVFAQSFKDWRLILVDDGSSDNSLEHALSVNDSRLEVISDGEHRGLPARLNQIAALADSPFLARMDADDLMHPDRLKTQWYFLATHPQVDLVSTGLYSVDSAGKIVGRRGETHSEFSPRDLLRRRVGLAHATIVARTAWAQRNPYDESVDRVEDLDLWIRAARKGDLRAQSLESPLYFYQEFRSINAQTLLRTQLAEARLIWQHGNFADRLQLEARVGAKALMTCLLTSVGQLDWLLRRRNPGSVNSLERENSAQVINFIREVKLPT